jgi:hypothetical protein
MTTEQLEHNFADPAVVLAEGNLRDTLRTLDDYGVTMVEEQFRAFDNEQQSLATAWAECRKSGVKTLCPEFLHIYATDAVKQEVDEHIEGQDNARRILVRCRFNKPTAVLPTGDAEEGDAIKMTLVIPADDISRTTVLKDFLVGKRVLAEFSLRSSDKWDVLPEMDLPEIIACETELKGLTWLMKGYRISFKVSTDLIDDNTAIRQYANHNGSLRLTVLGDIEKAEKKNKDVAPISHGDAQPLPGQQPLFNLSDPSATNRLLDDDGEFTAPDEYLVPLKGKNTSATIYVGVGEDGLFYSSFDLYFVDGDGDVCDVEFGNPSYEKNTGKPSLQQAVIAEVGSMIDNATGQDCSPKTINELKTYLGKLEKGEAPTPMLE